MPTAVSKKKTFQFPEVRVVEASAGSGKTYALAKRYIQLILNPEIHQAQIPIRNILALTFTNKAAFEMKARILEFLKSIALGAMLQDQLDDILKPIGCDPQSARQKAFLIMEDVIRHYNFFQVQTIDKFINALLSGCAFKVGLTANFRIKTNAMDYLQYSLDELIDQASTNDVIRAVFENFLHHYLYLENRNGWFPKDDMMAIIGVLHRQNNTYGLRLQEGPFTAEDLIKKKKGILKDMQDLKGVLPEKTDLRFSKILDKFLTNHTKGFDVDSVSEYFAREHIPIKKGGVSSKEVDHLWNRIHKNLRSLCEEEAFSLFNPYIQIFEMVRQGFADLSARDDVLFLEELNKRAVQLFDEDYITVEELYYRLATRFHHYLIDEFQDTNRLQWRNVEKMTEEALSTGGSLFYVGDRKQAIYGFRGGEVGLFDNIKEQYQAFNVQIEQLTNNWRSEKAIVEFNNHVFSMENIKNFILEKEAYEEKKKKKNPVVFTPDDYKELERVFGSSQQTYQEKNKCGYVHFEYIDVDKREERVMCVRDGLIQRIELLKQRFALRDIAILTRSNYEIELVTNWLLEEGIQVESERTSNVRENSVVEELVCLLRFLHSPIDNVSFAHFILGEVFAQASGLSQAEMRTFVFKLRDRLRREKDFYLYREFRQKYKDVWDQYLDKFFKNVGLYPLYELTVSIFHRYDCLNAFSQYQGFQMHFLELIKKCEDEHSDIEAFLQYYDQLVGEDLYVHITESDAIKVLTVHKSKGLEFPVVILPFLGMDIQVGSSGPDMYQSYVLDKQEETLSLIRLKAKYFRFSDKLYHLFAREYKHAFLSELNNVYVAMTRPQKELYGFIPKKVGSSFNFLKFLIPEEWFQRGQEVAYEETKKKQVLMKNLPSPQCRDWIDYLKDEFMATENLKTRKRRLRGEIIHTMLSFIHSVTKEGVDEIVQNAILQTESVFGPIEEENECRTTLTQLLNHEPLRDVFYVSGAEVLNEREFVNSTGHTKRIDRMVVHKNKIDIIDYKSSKAPEAGHEEQIREYVTIVKELYPAHEVRGTLVYFDELISEEVL